uniref:Enoyl-CoA hydratase n=1 Tax=Ditylenchus dipsaci TaxID=166011 RepID=A0A915DZ17_9BILA
MLLVFLTVSKTYKLLIENLALADKDDDISMTVITGVGDFFSSGNEFSASKIKNIAEDPKSATTLVQQFVDALIGHSKVLIGLVNGPAIGIACTTLALFDCVVCTDDAYFSCPFTKLGLLPEGTSSLSFPLIMGHSKAAQMLLFSEKMSANEAKQAGLVNIVIPRQLFKAESEKILQKYAQLMPQSLLKAKQLMRTQQQRHLLHSANQQEIEAIQHQWIQPETSRNVQKAFSKPNTSKI